MENMENKNLEKQNRIEEAEQVLLHTYNRYPIILDHGEGMYLYDSTGKKYLDFTAGIAVCGLGYGNKEFSEALKTQIDKLLHTSNYYYSEPAIEAGEKFVKASGMDRVFFTNSGTEAIEGALKSAKKYAYTKAGHAGFEIIAMEHSFHGRSVGALSVTGTAHYREPFLPLMDGVKFAKFNDIESVKALVNEKTCAVILEPIQGEGGIYPADPDFLQQLRSLCDEKDILLIFDEIQCGMGRTGNMFAWQGYGVKPDILTTAKALGNGVPVGAFAMTQRVAEKSLQPGDHGTTYGGNPFVCAAASKVFDLFDSMHILENVGENGDYLTEVLEKIAEEFDCIKERLGLGFMKGLEFTVPVSDIIKKCQENGLLLINAGANVLRVVPPLIAEKKHIDEMAEILRKSVRECQRSSFTE